MSTPTRFWDQPNPTEVQKRVQKVWLDPKYAELDPKCTQFNLAFPVFEPWLRGTDGYPKIGNIKNIANIIVRVTLHVFGTNQTR